MFDWNLQSIEYDGCSSGAAVRSAGWCPKRRKPRREFARQFEADVIFGQRCMRARSYTCGSLSRAQMILGAVKPVRPGFGGLGHERFFADCLRDIVALRLRALVAPENGGPQHFVRFVEHDLGRASVPDKPTPAISSAGTVSRMRRTPLQVASHQSDAFCSAHIGRGVSRGYSSVALAATLPVSSIARTLVPLVPMSMPNK
jgi:hypothetical protein